MSRALRRRRGVRSGARRGLRRGLRHGRRAYRAPAGATNVLLDVNPAHYADADSVYDVSGNLTGFATKGSSAVEVQARRGHRAIFGDGSGLADLRWAGQVPKTTMSGTCWYVVCESDNRGNRAHPVALGDTSVFHDVDLQANGTARAISYDGLSDLAEGNDYSERQLVVYSIEHTGSAINFYENGTLQGTDSSLASAPDLTGLNTTILSRYGSDPLDGWVYRWLIDEAAYSATLNDHLLSLYGAQDVAWADATEYGNSGTTETDATVYYLPPNTLTADGDRLELETSTKWNTTGSHVQRFYFNGTSVSSRTINNTGIEEVREYRLVRTGSTTAEFQTLFRTSASTKGWATLARTSLDFTDAIEIKTTLTGATATDDITQHYFRVRSHKVAGTYTLDVDATGGTTSGTDETTLATLTIPAGALDASNPFAEVEVPVYKTGTAGNGTIRLKVGGTTVRTITEAAAESYQLQLTVARTSGGYQVAHGFVESGGTSDFQVEDEVATDLDVNDLTITVTGQDADAADALDVVAYTAHARQVQCLDSDVAGATSTGVDGTLVGPFTVPAQDEDGKGFRFVHVGEWDSSPNGAAVVRHYVNPPDTSMQGIGDVASAHILQDTRMARTGSTSGKPSLLYWRGTASAGSITEAGINTLDWTAESEVRVEEASHDVGDYTVHWAYVEALP